MPPPSTHPEDDRLRAFAAGLLPFGEAESTIAHLRDCPRCVSHLGSLPTNLRTATISVAPPLLTIDSPNSPVVVHSEAGEIPADLADHPRYRIIQWLGEGGMGAVFRAEHRIMERVVALKVIHQRFTSNLNAVERFRREAKAAANLSHPNIVQAFDAEQAGSTHFFVMEYVAGRSLADYLRERRWLPFEEAVAYAIQVADGLEHAHQRGMVHRDIKPDNLMRLPTGTIKILDFGLARFGTAEELRDGDAIPGAESGRLTSAGTVMGTPDYIAPEQVGDAASADIRADIYSLGCTLYHLLVGHVPFPRGTVSEKLRAHRNESPEPLAKLRPDCPPGVVAVVERMMAKSPTDRFLTPADVATALKAALIQPRSRRRPFAILAVAVAGIAVALYANRPPPVTPVPPIPPATVIEEPDPIGKPGWSRSPVFYPDGKHLIGIDGDTVVRWGMEPLNTFQVVGRHLASVECVAVAPDGKSVAAVDSAGWLRVWNIGDANRELTTRAHRANTSSVAYSNNGNSLATGSADGTAIVWDAATRSARRTFPIGAKVDSVAFRPGGGQLVVAGEGGWAFVFDLATGERLQSLNLGGKDWGVRVAYSRDGRRLAVGSDRKGTRVWDADTFTELSASTAPSSGALVFTPGGETLLTMESYVPDSELCVRAVDVATGSVVERIRVPPPPGDECHPAIRPDGKRFAVPIGERVLVEDVPQ